MLIFFIAFLIFVLSLLKLFIHLTPKIMKKLLLCLSIFLGAFFEGLAAEFGAIKNFARIQLASNLDDARGKIGNIVYSKGRSVHTQRKRVKPTNPQTSYQSTIRAYVKQFSSAWRSLLPAQIVAWNEAALQLSKSNVFGGKYHTTGHKLFVAWNCEAFMNGATVQIADPFDITIPAVVQVSAIDPDSTGTPHFTVTTAEAVPSNSKLIIECTSQVSAGISNFKGRYRRVAVLAGGTSAGAQDIISTYTARFGDLISGKKISVRVYTTNNDAAKQVIKFKAGCELAKIVK